MFFPQEEGIAEEAIPFIYVVLETLVEHTVKQLAQILRSEIIIAALDYLICVSYIH